jgi:DNA-binding LacI/PurR family transcriptional regulator
MPGMMDKTITLLHGIRVVQYPRRHPHLSAPVMTTGGKVGIHLAAEHLLTLGHPRIAYVGMKCDKRTSVEQLAGFMAAHADFKGLFNPAPRRLGPPPADFARDAVTDLPQRAEPPSAMIL